MTRYEQTRGELDRGDQLTIRFEYLEGTCDVITYWDENRRQFVHCEQPAPYSRMRKWGMTVLGEKTVRLEKHWRCEKHARLAGWLE